jgi:predicted transcriptional regulator
MSWFVEMCKEMEAQHGERGWKRKLAGMLGVSDSNVQNWIRAGDAPPIVRTAYEAKEEIRDLESELAAHERDNFIIEELADGRGFRVLSLLETGRFCELATARTIELARAIIQVESGALDQKISDTTSRLWDSTEDHPDDRKCLMSLEQWNQPTRREQRAKVTASLHSIMKGS